MILLYVGRARIITELERGRERCNAEMDVAQLVRLPNGDKEVMGYNGI